MSDDRQVQHSETGTYSVAELIPEECLDLTLEQILALLAAKIVDHPDDVQIHVVNTSRIKVIEFQPRPEDQGPLLGRKGYTVHALRTISKAILGPLTKRYSYKVSIAHDQDGR